MAGQALYYGMNALSHNVIMADRKKLKSANGMYLGSTGSGKMCIRDSLVCVAIYAVLIQGIATGGDPIGAIWGTVGYTVLLCFMLFKTGSIAQRIFGAH